MVFTSLSDWFCIETQLLIEVCLTSRTDGSCHGKCCSCWYIELVWVVMVLRGDFSKSAFTCIEVFQKVIVIVVDCMASAGLSVLIL